MMQLNALKYPQRLPEPTGQNAIKAEHERTECVHIYIWVCACSSTGTGEPNKMVTLENQDTSPMIAINILE